MDEQVKALSSPEKLTLSAFLLSFDFHHPLATYMKEQIHIEYTTITLALQQKQKYKL